MGDNAAYTVHLAQASAPQADAAAASSQPNRVDVAVDQEIPRIPEHVISGVDAAAAATEPGGRDLTCRGSEVGCVHGWAPAACTSERALSRASSGPA